MKLAQQTDVSGKDKGVSFGDTKFRIGNEAIIFHILRHKMYSNPIRIICQEIMSNARDAHREVEKFTVPIVVTPPSGDNLFLRIRDFGPGINPQRMQEVFVAYGSSTKRDDDMQTGGFGIGAKTPWSYAPWFEIISITEEDDIRTKRHYRAYLDETGIGRLSLKDENFIDTDDDTQQIGVEFIIPVKEDDIGNFWSEIKYVADYWKMAGGVRPQIIGEDIDWTYFENITVSSGTNWAVLTKSNYGNNREDRPLAIVDGIPYPIDISALLIDNREKNFDKADFSISRATGQRIRLFFSPDEIAVAANREALDYNNDTIDVILFRFKNCFDALRKSIVDELNKCANFWDACCLYTKLSSGGTFPIDSLFKEIKWSDCKLEKNYIKPEIGKYSDNLSKLYHVECEDGKIGACRPASIIEFKPDTKLVVDDTGGSRPSRTRLRTVFKENSSCTSCCVILLSEDKVKDIKCLDDSFHLIKMDPIWLSMVEATSEQHGKRAIRHSSGRRRQIVKVSMFDGKHWVPSEIDVANDSGYFVVKHYNNYYWDWAQSKHCSNVEWYAKELGIFVYAIVPSLKDKVGPNMIPFRNAVLDKLQKMLADPVLQQNELEAKAFWAEKRLPFDIKQRKFVTLLRGYDPNHLVIRYLNQLGIVHCETFFQPVRVIENIRSEFNIEFKGDVGKSVLATLTREIQTKYPLMWILKNYEVPAGTDDAIYNYILAVDAGKL